MTILVRGGTSLNGKVVLGGAKNAALPILAASILSSERTVIRNVPHLLDVRTMVSMLRSLGVEVSHHKDEIRISPATRLRSQAPYELVRKMRASFLVMGPLLVRCGIASVPLPGGCAIGSRPVDFHLKGLEALGASINVDSGYINGVAPGLKGAIIYLDFPSVGATENIMMAASLARGETLIENAAQEPEVVDLANFLNAMGAKIKGAGTSGIRIDGVPRLYGTDYTVIPDRIEASTYLIAAAITKGRIVLENAIPSHLGSVLSKLKETGAKIIESPKAIELIMDDDPSPVNLKTLPYPGFPTDVQSPFMSLLALAKGTSIISETIFESRFSQVEELRRMGAKIRIEGSNAILEGVPNLMGASVKAKDLRAGAALTLAALAAKGVTEIAGTEHINRGYHGFVEKLGDLGARIEWSSPCPKGIIIP